MKERNLIQGLKQHNPQALQELIQAYSPYVGTIIRNIIGKTLTESDVEELTADVFLAVWENVDSLENGRLNAYLAAIARNKAKNSIRSYHETTQIDDIIEISSDDNIENTIDQKLMSEMLQKALDKLPPKDKEVLVRYYYYCESVKAIADSMHASKTSVKMRMSRARKKLQQELLDLGYEKKTPMLVFNVENKFKKPELVKKGASV